MQQTEIISFLIGFIIGAMIIIIAAIKLFFYFLKEKKRQQEGYEIIKGGKR